MKKYFNEGKIFHIKSVFPTGMFLVIIIVLWLLTPKSDENLISL